MGPCLITAAMQEYFGHALLETENYLISQFASYQKLLCIY